MDQFLEELGARIAEKRKEQGLTQEELAECVGVTNQTISLAELGKTALKVDNFFKITERLEVTADYLLTGRKINSDLELLNKRISTLSRAKHAWFLRIVEDLLEEC